MWYITFHGGEPATPPPDTSDAVTPVNNIQVFDDGGACVNPALLPTGGANPALKELRGLAFAGDKLYVINGYKAYSQVLLYQSDGHGGYTFDQVFASGKVDAMLHPFDLTFDSAGNCYISNQDTNVVAALKGADDPLPVASYLKKQYPPPAKAKYLDGTFAASSIGKLPHVPKPHPPDILQPQGLDVAFATPQAGASAKTAQPKVANSVRGVVAYDGYIYAADEPGNAVKAYKGASGKLHGQITGVIAGVPADAILGDASTLGAPIHLLLRGAVLYIGSSSNGIVAQYDLSNGPPKGSAAPDWFIDGGANPLRHISGMAFDSTGNFYVAERLARKIRKFDPSGKEINDFNPSLPDYPEFIFYVPTP
jgi:hypothetical protein